MSHYIRLPALLSITLTVTWHLLLIFYNVKVIQPPYCNNSYKGAHSALHKWLCWEFWGKSQICLDYILGAFDVCCDLLGNSLKSVNPFNLIIRFCLNGLVKAIVPATVV